MCFSHSVRLMTGNGIDKGLIILSRFSISKIQRHPILSCLALYALLEIVLSNLVYSTKSFLIQRFPSMT